jgi:hypothetical protein
MKLSQSMVAGLSAFSLLDFQDFNIQELAMNSWDGIAKVAVSILIATASRFAYEWVNHIVNSWKEKDEEN